MSQFEVSFSPAQIKCTSTPTKRRKDPSLLVPLMPKTSTVIDFQAAVKSLRFNPIDEPSRIECCLSTTTRLPQKKTRLPQAPIHCSSFANPIHLDCPECYATKRASRKRRDERSSKVSKHSSKKPCLAVKLTRRFRSNCFYLPACLSSKGKLMHFEQNDQLNNQQSFFKIYFL